MINSRAQNKATWKAKRCLVMNEVYSQNVVQDPLKWPLNRLVACHYTVAFLEKSHSKLEIFHSKLEIFHSILSQNKQSFLILSVIFNNC